MQLKSNFLTLQQRDAVKCFIIAVGTPVLYWVQTDVINWHIPEYIRIAISGGVTYLLKNLFSNDAATAQQIVEEQGGKIVRDATKTEPASPQG